MKIYDKAKWHIDGGEKEKEVIERFNIIFTFLKENNMLSPEGLETLEFCMDSSVSLNSNMVNTDGKDFLDAAYDDVIKQPAKKIKGVLTSSLK